MKQARGKEEPIGEPPEDEATNRPPASQGVTESPTLEAAPPEQEAPKPRRKRQKNSAPSKNETPSK